MMLIMLFQTVFKKTKFFKNFLSKFEQIRSFCA